MRGAFQSLVSWLVDLDDRTRVAGPNTPARSKAQILRDAPLTTVLTPVKNRGFWRTREEILAELERV